MKTIEMNEGVVARIDYLKIKGEKIESIDYTNYEDNEEFAEDVKAELSNGVSIRVTYVDDNGNIVSKNLMNDHDCLPKFSYGRVGGSFAKAFEKSLEALSKVYSITDEPTVVRL